MIARKNLMVLVAALFFAVGLAGCMPGTPMASGGDIDISMDAAMDGQNAVLAGAMTGAVSLTESQASSLITELAKQNGLNSIEIAGISADVMDDGKNSILVELASPIAGIDALGLTASVISEGGVVTVDLDEAFAGGWAVDGATLDAVSAQINASAGGMMMGLPDGPIALTSDQAAQISTMMGLMGLNSAEISAVKTQFDGGHISVVAELANAVAGVDALGLSAAVSLDDGMASVHLSEAFAGGLLADSGLVSMVNDQINASLAAYRFVPASIDSDGGNLMVGIGQ